MTDRFFPIGDVSRSLHPGMAYEGDAGYDLFAQESACVKRGAVTTIKTGWGVLLEPGEVGLICPRSGLATVGVTIVNAPGIVDSGYSGEIVVLLTSLAQDTTIVPGQAVAQLVIVNHSDVNTLGDPRLKQGFGSSD